MAELKFNQTMTENLSANSGLSKNWLRFDGIFFGSVIALDFWISMHGASNGFAVSFIYYTIGFAVLFAMLQFIASMVYFIKSDTKRGFFYLLHIVVWFTIAFLLFIIHSFLIWSTPSVNVG